MQYCNSYAIQYELVWRQKYMPSCYFTTIYNIYIYIYIYIIYMCVWCVCVCMYIYIYIYIVSIELLWNLKECEHQCYLWSVTGKRQSDLWRLNHK